MENEIKTVIEKISQIVKFPSYEQAPLAGMPFGAGVNDCLNYFLSLAEQMGFETKNYDGYAGEVIWGEGEEFAVLAHLDVVPAGSGWTKEPFGGEIDLQNKKVWGRGTMDDKGPAIISLYALKSLKDEGFTPRRKIKLIVGCNEESGWKCIDYYKAHAHMPDEGFSPDSDFPVIYAEKGIMHVELNFEAEGVENVYGGERGNMVCDYCEASAPIDWDRLKTFNLTVENGKIISVGKSAHGSTPQLGKNAIAPLLKYLKLDKMHSLLFENDFSLEDMRDETGNLTFSPNVIRQSGKQIFVTCDIRYPATHKREEVLARIEKSGVKYKIIHEQAPLFSDKNSPLIKTLCSVYNEVTGKSLAPVAIGGGTYARALKRGAAFGPEEVGEECTIHQADEYITFEKIEKCFKIYKLALKRIAGKN